MQKGFCSTDAKLLDVVEAWERGRAVEQPILHDRVFLDELQDMRPSFHRALRHMLAPGRQMIVLGDENQMLYDYQEDDAAGVVGVRLSHASAAKGDVYVDEACNEVT